MHYTSAGGVLSAFLIGADPQVKEIFTIGKRAKYTDMKALVLLVTVNGIAVAISLVQVLRCALSMINGTVLTSPWLGPFFLVIKVDDSGVRFDTVARTTFTFSTLKTGGKHAFMFCRNPSADMLL